MIHNKEIGYDSIDFQHEDLKKVLSFAANSRPDIHKGSQSLMVCSSTQVNHKRQQRITSVEADPHPRGSTELWSVTLILESEKMK